MCGAVGTCQYYSMRRNCRYMGKSHENCPQPSRYVGFWILNSCMCNCAYIFMLHEPLSKTIPFHVHCIILYMGKVLNIPVGMYSYFRLSTPFILFNSNKLTELCMYIVHSLVQVRFLPKKLTYILSNGFGSTRKCSTWILINLKDKFANSCGLCREALKMLL